MRETNWPRLRAILDEAINSERGIIVAYPSWTVAETVRAQIYKIRDMQRRESRKVFIDPEDPNYGVSSYDGLTFWLRSSVKRTHMHVAFHDEADIEKYEQDMADVEEAESSPPSSVLNVACVGDFYPEGWGKADEKSKLFPGKCVTVVVRLEGDDQVTIEYAPSFQEAWAIIRNDFPCSLVIENGYSLEGLDIQIIGEDA